MVTVNMSGQYGVTGTNKCVLYGLSTDTKPTGGVMRNGYAFVEMDTSTVYLYSEASEEWLVLGGGSTPSGTAIVGVAVVGTAVVG